MKTLLSLLLTLGVPKWAIVMALAALATWAAPKVFGEIERDRARRVVKAARLDPEPKRAEADARALELAGQDHKALVLLAEEAMDNGRRALVDQVLARLLAGGLPPAQLARLEDRRYGPLPALPAEAALRVASLLERNQVEEAGRLASRAVRRWPGEEQLRELAARCVV